jgi:hypothetical protein
MKAKVADRTHPPYHGAAFGANPNVCHAAVSQDTICNPGSLEGERMKTLAAALAVALAMPAVAGASATVLPPAAAPSALPAPPPPVEPAAYGKSSGVIPGVVFGPKLSILSIPAPGVGFEAKILNAFGLSFDYDLIPKVSLMEVSAGYHDWNVAAKWYPWRGAFFLGAAVGRRTFEASAKDVTTGLKASVEVESSYVVPEIGWRWVWNSGFFLGMDLGYQIVTSSRTKLEIPSVAATTDAAEDVTHAGEDLGRIGFPILSLLQVGIFF